LSFCLLSFFYPFYPFYLFYLFIKPQNEKTKNKKTKKQRPCLTTLESAVLSFYVFMV